jgi:hypothetical protein
MELHLAVAPQYWRMHVREASPVARLASELGRKCDGVRLRPWCVAAEPFEERPVDRDVAQRRRLVRGNDRDRQKLRE